MANEIKQTIRLDGEREYNSALQAAQRNLKTLRSELKAETAEMGANATAQQKNEARAKSLQKQIKEQEKVVETLRKALDEAKRDYGDNEDVVQKWEQKLNQARTTLANMSNELGTLENGMRGASDATAEGVTASKSFADAVQSIASIGDSVSGALQGIFTGLIDTVRDVAVELWDFIGETAAKANEWSDIAGYWNTDAATIQKWENAVRSAGNQFSDFESIVSRINLGGKGDKITELLGVSDVNYKNDWDYAIAVMERAYELRSKGQLTDEFWETIFGEKKATKAMDILNDWETIRDNLDDFDADNGGFGIDSETIKTMSDVHEEMQKTLAMWDSLKRSVAGGLGEISADLIVNVQGSLGALNDFMKAETDEDREAALEKLKQNIKEFFAKVKVAIEEGLELLKEIGSDWADDDDPVIAGIGKLLLGIEETLQWILDNADAVGIALAGIFGASLLTKLGAVGLQIAGMAAQLKVISAFNGLGAAAEGAGAAAAGGAGAASAAGAGGVGAASVAGAFATWVKDLIPKAGIAAAIGYLYKQAADYRQEYGPIGSTEAIEKSDGELLAALDDVIKTQRDLQAAIDDMTNYTDDEFQAIGERATEASERFYGMDGATDLMKRYSEWRDAEGYGNMDWIDYHDIEEAVAEGVARGTNGDNKDTAMADGLNGLKGLPAAVARAVVQAVSKIKVNLDGREVGEATAPYVSQAIGGRAYAELR